MVQGRTVPAFLPFHNVLQQSERYVRIFIVRVRLLLLLVLVLLPEELVEERVVWVVLLTLLSVEACVPVPMKVAMKGGEDKKEGRERKRKY